MMQKYVSKLSYKLHLPVMPKRILICPLNWGLGHATRCVPVINAIIKQGADVLLAADGAAFDFLKLEFSEQKIIRLPGYNIRYPLKGNMIFSMVVQLPKIFSAIKAEHLLLRKIIDEHNIDIVVSDNRYGCYSENIPSVFITHQLHIQTPPGLLLLKPFINSLNKKYISRFTKVWVPDIAGENNLTEKLSHPPAKNAVYIGALSRFKNGKNNFKEKYRLLVLLSGPEPQRTMLEQKLLKQLENFPEPVLFVRGVFCEEKILFENSKIVIENFISKEDLMNAFAESEMVICRSGYSTIMDLAALGKKAILIPTPGQTEQEYLAKKFSESKTYFSAAQKDFRLIPAIEAAKNFTPIKISNDYRVLADEINKLIN